MKTETPDAARSLVELIAGFGSCAVAFSGGVDSAVVAKAAQLALGRAGGRRDRQQRQPGQRRAGSGQSSGRPDRHPARGDRYRRTGPGPTTPPTDPTAASTARPSSTRNSNRWPASWAWQRSPTAPTRDDLGDYRPGMQAAAQHRVRSPLAECGLDKAAVRRLALAWELPVWDKPAMPCLSSRVAYGEAVTPERLEMIDRAEQFLRRLGLDNSAGPLPQRGPGADRSAGRGDRPAEPGGNARGGAGRNAAARL